MYPAKAGFFCVLDTNRLSEGRPLPFLYSSSAKPFLSTKIREEQGIHPTFLQKLQKKFRGETEKAVYLQTIGKNKSLHPNNERNTTMTKADLVNQISANTGVDKASVLSTIESFMSIVKDSLAADENVYLRGFGSFIVKKRAQKTARNISKNTTIIVPEHNIPAFRPAKDFYDALS